MRIWWHDILVNIVYNALSQDHPRNSVLHVMVGYVQVMFSILNSYMVNQLILTSPYPALLLYPSLLPVGVATAAGEVAKDESTIADHTTPCSGAPFVILQRKISFCCIMDEQCQNDFEILGTSV